MAGASNRLKRTSPMCYKGKNMQKDDAKSSRLRLVAADTDMGKAELQAESNPDSNKHVKDARTSRDTGTVESYSIKNSPVTTIEPCGHHRTVTEVTDDTLTSLIKEDIPVGDPLAEKWTLQAGIDQWEEKLRRLSLVKCHKGNLSKLQQLTARWQQVSQQVLLQLQERAPADERPSLGQLMDHMGINEDMLELDREQDCFNC
ncbi:PREDICTED: uncharacterized protein LOC109486730 [Branchiostoma belcheri]|uniref:Swi5-dependent recombination DNA repair protein 1 homolog n=1 Tax=Branchiostoma belcheri TaxID=7741 RepID=A0A6P5ASW2_BRABE|nr:PREDICTED: uncharacterized protein LOC109486730 [Branchiostoma belcheri]